MSLRSPAAVRPVTGSADAPLAGLGGAVLTAVGLLSAGLPLLATPPLAAGLWPWAGSVEIGAAVLVGLAAIGFALLAAGGDARLRALAAPAPALLGGLLLLSIATSFAAFDPQRLLTGHPAVGFGGLWLLLAAALAAIAGVFAGTRLLRLICLVHLVAAPFTAVFAQWSGAPQVGALVFQAIVIAVLLHVISGDLPRPAPRRLTGVLLAGAAVAMSFSLQASPAFQGRDLALETILFGAGWGAAWDLAGLVAPRLDIAFSLPGASGETDFLSRAFGFPGVGAPPLERLALGLPAEGLGALSTGSVLGEIMSGVGLAGALVVTAGFIAVMRAAAARAADDDGRRAWAALGLAGLALASAPPLLVFAPSFGLLAARAMARPVSGEPPVPSRTLRAGAGLGLFALGFAAFAFASGLSALTRHAEHDVKLPGRFLERPDACIATRTWIAPERDMHLALQRRLAADILASEDPVAQAARRASVIASAACIMALHEAERPSFAMLEARLEMRTALFAAARRATFDDAEIAPPPSLALDIESWAAEIERALAIAPNRLDLAAPAYGAVLLQDAPGELRRLNAAMPSSEIAAVFEGQVRAAFARRDMGEPLAILSPIELPAAARP